MYGNFPGDPMLEQHFDPSNPDSIPCTVGRVLLMAKERGVDTNAAAVMMADEASRVVHPITGHRCVLGLLIATAMTMTHRTGVRSLSNG